MVPFARVPDLVVQPESWFELGNPNVETVCIDLAYRLPGGGNPIFTSGDDATREPPRGSSPELRGMVPRAAAQGGREYGSTRISWTSATRGRAHRRHAPSPALCDWLRPFAERVGSLLDPGADERDIAARLGLSRPDVELIFRHLQHVGAVPSADERTGPGVTLPPSEHWEIPIPDSRFQRFKKIRLIPRS